MGYLFTKIFLWLMIATGLGVLTGWFVWGRRDQDKPDMRTECDRLRGRLNSAHTELASCREKLVAAESAALASANPEKPESAPKMVKPASVATEQEPVPAVAQVKSAPGPADLPENEPAPDDWQPILLTQPQGEKDNLQRIKGVGPKIEGILNDLGIYHFSQIAAFTEQNIAWVNDHLKFKGRIQREKWIEQARQLDTEK